MHEKHSYRLIRDLFAHKEAIFGELKRASTLSHTPSGGNASNAARVRAISTDESNRRANMEARNRAIASKSRNSSPAPHGNARSHRRDRSSDPPTTRFPIQTNQTSPTAGEQRRVAIRASLEVPSETSSPQAERTTNHNSLPNSSKTIPEHTSTVSEDTPPSAGHIISTNTSSITSAPSDEANGVSNTFAEKRDSLGRASRFPPRKTGGQGSLANLNRSSLGSETGERHGVQLSDKPMDD